MVYRQLAKLADVEVDFNAIQGNYKPKPVSANDVLSDAEIEALWESLTNPGWSWVYRMLATYGLRTHEVFRLSDSRSISSSTGKISILDNSKTGARDVWPLPDKWRLQFRLEEVVR